MQTGNDDRSVNLDEVTRLLEALERDLARVRSGSSDIDTLRTEVEQLRAVLRSAQPSGENVHAGLHNIRDVLHRAGDELRADIAKAADYVAQIARMLGL